MSAIRRLLPVLLLAGAVNLLGAGGAPTRHDYMLRVETEGIQSCRTAGFASSDPAIRKYALARSFEVDPAGTLVFAEKLTADSAPEVRALAARLLAYEINAARRAILEKLAESDSNQEVRWAASSALWPFARKNVLLKDDPAWDHLVKSAGGFAFPATDWQYAADPARNGHLHGFFALSGNAGKWAKKAPGQLEKAGVHWYRVKFTPLPPAKFNAFEIVLPEVAGKCFVWLNGIYLGDRLSEDKAEVRLNGTQELLLKNENTLVIRIESSHACGITAPVRGEWME